MAQNRVRNWAFVSALYAEWYRWQKQVKKQTWDTFFPHKDNIDNKKTLSNLVNGCKNLEKCSEDKYDGKIRNYVILNCLFF